MKNAELLLGLEIEADVNGQLFDHDVGGYHETSWVSKHWSAESDGSLAGGKFFPYDRMVEFVSKPFMESELHAVLEDFKALFHGVELSKAIDINHTCGNHIHVSLIKSTGSPKEHAMKGNSRQTISYQWGSTAVVCKGDRQFMFPGRFLPMPMTKRTLAALRKRAMASMTAAGVRRYWRGAARRMRWRVWDPRVNLKHYEWHPINMYHAEYRSFNLADVKTWKELEDCYKGMIKALHDCLLSPLRESRRIPIPEPSITAAVESFTASSKAVLEQHIRRRSSLACHGTLPDDFNPRRMEIAIRKDNIPRRHSCVLSKS